MMTSDRDPAMWGQWEDQMIDQVGMFDRHVRKSVNLPVINNNADFHFCQRLVNEALMELFHHGSGPVHINIPMVSYNVSFNQKSLVDVVKYDRLEYARNEELWAEKKEKLTALWHLTIWPILTIPMRGTHVFAWKPDL